jgi:hypothetical protein
MVGGRVTDCGRFSGRTLAGALSGALAAGVPLAAGAQYYCPPGYYYASDNNCYPGSPPSAPPPPTVYETAPAVPPPVVTDGLLLGLGILIGSLTAGDRYHGDGYGHHEERGPPPRRAAPEEHRYDEGGHR